MAHSTCLASNFRLGSLRPSGPADRALARQRRVRDRSRIRRRDVIDGHLTPGLRRDPLEPDGAGSTFEMGGRRREVGMEEWPWKQLQAWLPVRCELPVEPLFCVVTDPTRGRRWSAAAVRAELRDTPAAAAVHRRFAPQQPGAPRTRSG
jgi:hypothetical protein